MKTHGTASKKMSTGQFREFSGAVLRALPDDLDENIVQGWIENQESLRRVLRDALAPAGKSVSAHVIDLDADPYVPVGWSVEKHKRGGKLKWDSSRVRLHLSEKQKSDKWIEGNKLCKELQDLPVLNANVLDFLLAHSELIPEDWKSRYVFFWGTIYSDPSGFMCVRYLEFRVARWRCDYIRLENDFNFSNPAAVSVD